MGKVVSYRHETKPLPNQLLGMYRQRSGLTQKQLAAQLGLKSDRMIHKWESGDTMPTAARLQSLLQFYVHSAVFVVGSELEEARRLWQAIKDMFDLTTATFETYPIFDEDWFVQLLTEEYNKLIDPNLPGAGHQEATPLNSPDHGEKLAKVTSASKAVGSNPPPSLSTLTLNPQLPTSNHNLPHSLSSFIGRQQEIEALQQRLVAQRERLLTVVGAGGCGKTRLALKVAGELVDSFADGVWLVELASLSDPRLIAQAISGVLGLSEQTGQSILDQLRDYVNGRQLLLVLDNCEHLVAECARVVESLLEVAPRLQILATSREALGLNGEAIFRVPSLKIPDLQGHFTLEELAKYEAVRLFVERSTLISPGFTLTRHNASALVQICQQLDGIPLALELAAARTNLLSVEQIASRLADRFGLLTGGSRTALPRQQTLRALVDWSYELLSEAEKQLLVQLSVFVGGWTLAAAEAVCIATTDTEVGLAGYEVMEALSGLVNKSLVQMQFEEQPDSGIERRYYFLETVRQYAQEKLVAGVEEQPVRSRHLAYYARLVEELDINAGLRRREHLAVLKWLQLEMANLRAALDWGLANGPVEPILELIYQLAYFWDVRGYFREGRYYAEQAIALTERSGLERGRAYQAIFHAGWLARRQGDIVAALPYFEEAYLLSKDHNDQEFVVNALTGMGVFHTYRGEYSEARQFYQQAVKAREQINDPFVKAGFEATLAMALANEGDYEQASRVVETAVVSARQYGDSWKLSTVLSFGGTIAAVLGDYGRVQDFLEEALSISEEMGFPSVKATALTWLGIVAYEQGHFAQALTQIEASLELNWKNGQSYYTLEALVAVAGVLSKSGRQTGQAHLLKQSACLSGAIAALATGRQQVLRPVIRRYYEQVLSEAQAGLDATTFEEAFGAGQALSSIEATLTYAQEALKKAVNKNS